MRIVMKPQIRMGETDIAAIKLNPKSRDDIPQLLKGLQYIYTTPGLRERVFAILEELLPEREDGKGKVSAETGRPGMAQWKILVLGVVRLGLNADYDRIVELANEHSTLREFLGHGRWDREEQYELQTVKDNLRMFTPELLSRINEEVVKAGHILVKKKDPDEKLNARCDSFVVETDIHYPTDINLLYDAIRKAIELCGELSKKYDQIGWRQSRYQVKSIKREYRAVQQRKRSRSKDEVKREEKEEDVRTAHQLYLERATEYLERANKTYSDLVALDIKNDSKLDELKEFILHGERQIDQIRRRILQGESIPHEEKVFSLFQPHTEWISKGKAGVPVEFGLRVCVVEDQYRFILHHEVMEKQTDDQVAVGVVKATLKYYARVRSFSFDKGFHSPSNQNELAELLERVVLPKKGKLSEKRRVEESEPEFRELRRQHSGVESAINALEVHGLDKCPYDGLAGFKRYVALAVLARNIHRLGAVLKENESKRREAVYQKAA